MTADLAQDIMRRAYDLDGPNLDRQAQRLGADGWLALTAWIEFSETGTGGGLEMLTASLPEERTLGITDGQADLPTSADTFWLGVLDEDGHEEYGLHVG